MDMDTNRNPPSKTTTDTTYSPICLLLSDDWGGRKELVLVAMFAIADCRPLPLAEKKNW